MPFLTLEAAQESIQKFLAEFSPYLSSQWQNDEPFVVELLQNGVFATIATLLGNLPAATTVDQTELMRQLRRSKNRLALAVAVGDILDILSLEQVTHSLSDFAEAAITRAAEFLCRHHLALASEQRQAFLSRTATAPDAADAAVAAAASGAEDWAARAATSGLIILGMGKLGARELNYSSDIDLIILFDPSRSPPLFEAEGVRLGLGEIYQRIARDLVQILAAVTEDGFVHRTDLRLRPDPASTPRAISTTAAEIYYESVGQNWERAAMIKARPVGGDQGAGLGFLKRLRPFIWRRHLDFAAIADIHSIKRQITSKVGASAPARLRSETLDEPSPRLVTLTRGHNVKLGSGGIREIEFFAQTQQLIWGGRLPELRLAETCKTLNKLAELGLISETVAADMVAAYRELRRVEHRLQMVEDQQTHSLPADDHELERFSRFMGYGSVPEFCQALDPVLSLVALHFGQLFADQPTLGSSAPRQAGDSPSGSRNLVFTGTEDDPDTLQTLAQLGYSQPEQVAEMIRGWHYGRIRATRSARSREILTELIPALLAAFAATLEPQQSFVRLDRFLSSLPAGVEVLTLLKANPNLLTRLAEIMGTAPELAEILSTHPHLLDALVLSSGVVKQGNRTGDLQSRDQYRDQLLAVLGDCDGLEDILDAVRRWAAEQRFHIGIALLQRQLAPRLAVREYSQIAEAIIAVLLETVYAEFTRIHGFLPGGSLAVLGYGKLGGRILTPASDLDLVLVADHGRCEFSDGAKPLPPPLWFARLAQRLLSALTSPTASGDLYQVDMRLRPMGAKGPIVSTLDGFIAYHQDEAWHWETLALTRARIIAAIATEPNHDALAFEQQTAAGLAAVIETPRNPALLKQAVIEMAAMVHQSHPPRHELDSKYLVGGAFDLDFICQYLVLIWAPTHQGLAVVPESSLHLIDQLTALGALTEAQGQCLKSACEFYQSLQLLLRLTVGGDQKSVPPSLSLANLFVGLKLVKPPDQDACDAHTVFAELAAELSRHTQSVLQVWNEFFATAA